jgi:heme-degrading monooxygenase HmoA
MVPTPRTAYAALGLLLAGLYAGLAVADDKPAPAKPESPPGASSKEGYQKVSEQMLKALQESPGCLGVETARTSSGKQVVFAFFENKKAVLKWYYSPTHRELIEMLGTKYDGKRAPLKGVPDDVPVMAVAALSFGGKAASPNLGIPVSQISIEIFTPATGGLTIGGGFTPDAFRALMQKPRAKAGDQK